MSLVSIDQLTVDDVVRILEQAEHWEYLLDKGVKSNVLSGKILGNIFYEPSSRTSSSFHAAMLNLGGSVIPITATASSIAKGETLEDTVRTMASYCDILVLRHPEGGAAKSAASCSPVPVINAGDGICEHPTQALLDLYTIKKLIGKVENVTITMVGDLRHGRTVHSLTKLLNMFGAKQLHFISPESLQMPAGLIEQLKVPYTISNNLASVISTSDVLYVTRVQKERFSSLEEYELVKNAFIITPTTLLAAKNDMIVMHPLPRTTEIHPDVDSDPRAAYFKQMRHGVFVRMAILASSLGVPDYSK
uniref:aspartate carbamoyltransferase n=1 Tax=Spongospora subterranea TaxID=70186 RepID=A0A0H5R938_9EUKA|eukprot:CRZ10645.1 hypothetical protein [Spongospora subterranea]